LSQAEANGEFDERSNDEEKRQMMNQQRIIKLTTGQIIGHPLTMRQIKAERRQNRLRRREAFRKAKLAIAALRIRPNDV